MGLLQNSSLKKLCIKPGTFSGPKRLKKGSGFLFLHYFLVQVAIAFLFCNSPLLIFREGHSVLQNSFRYARNASPISGWRRAIST